MQEKAGGETSFMTPNGRPLTVTIVAWLYLAVGTIGFVYHSSEIFARHAFGYDDLWVELTEILAIVGGLSLLRGHNWARWLAIAWMAFHVLLSAFDAFRGVAIHSVFLAVITWCLFCRPATLYFSARRTESA